MGFRYTKTHPTSLTLSNGEGPQLANDFGLADGDQDPGCPGNCCTHWDTGKENGSYRGYRVYRGVILGYIGVIPPCTLNWGVMENEMEATILENQMEKKMENDMETGIMY